MKDMIPKIKIYETFDAAVLVCYLLNEIGSLSEECLLEIVTIDETVDAFILSDAIGICERKELTKSYIKNDEVLYKITKTGKGILSEFVDSLPLSIREKTLTEGKRVDSLRQLKKTVRWNISEFESGYYFIVKFLNEMGGPDIMQIKIYAPSKESAIDIEKRFLENPVNIIGNTLNLFTTDNFLF